MRHLKQEFDKLSFKETLTYIIAIVSLIAAYVLLFLAMYIDPEGEVHNSIITALAIILLFVGALLGVSMHFENELKSFKSSILGTVAAASIPAARHDDPEKSS